jgi:N-acetylglucosaminyldiphosphoundecaprenol N-acetyl-beta-D-mannosaminyltransferase
MSLSAVPQDAAARRRLTAELRAPHRLRRRPEERIRLLGAQVDLVKPQEMLLFVDRQATLGRPAIIANHNSHSLSLLQSEPLLSAFYEMADLIEADSTPLLLWARLVNGAGRGFHRCTYLDWRDAFWRKAAARGWKVFYLGGAPGVADAAAARITARYPGVGIRCRDGFFDAAAGSADNAALVDQINAYGPDILFVGMGMPRQEAWITLHQPYLNPCVTFSVGAAFDYEAGVQAAAPRWMGRLGVEWLFRLAHDPRRLFFRYVVEPWSLVRPALDDVAFALNRRGAGRKAAHGSDGRS